MIRSFFRATRPASLLVLTLLATAGCGKKGGPAPEGTTGEAVVVKRVETSAHGKELIPGENAVKEALAQKEYNLAIERYNALKVAVATPEQQDEYMSLYGQIRSELEDASSKDQKAAEALAMFRLIRNGR
jgi:hypothetical protein